MEVEEVDKFLNKGITATETVLQYPTILKLYRRHNTTLPSSVSVERLFSTGGQIFKPTRNRLSEKMFEMFLFMKANSDME